MKFYDDFPSFEKISCFSDTRKNYKKKRPKNGQLLILGSLCVCLRITIPVN